MGLESTIDKLDKYFKRLAEGKAQRIKLVHIEKVIRKLEVKEKLLVTDLADTAKDSKKKRLKRKLALVRDQQERARWLKKKIAT
jgi:hypothetical protein